MAKDPKEENELKSLSKMLSPTKNMRRYKDEHSIDFLHTRRMEYFLLAGSIQARVLEPFRLSM